MACACGPDLHAARDQSFRVSLIYSIEAECHGWMLFTHDSGLGYPYKDPIRHPAFGGPLSEQLPKMNLHLHLSCLIVMDQKVPLLEVNSRAQECICDNQITAVKHSYAHLCQIPKLSSLP